MPEQTVEPVAGTVAAQTQTAGSSATSKIEFTPEQQAQIEAIKIAEKKAWEKSHKEAFDKAKGYDELLAKQREKEQAEMTELEKLKSRIPELEKYESRTKVLEEKIAAILQAKIEQIPEENRTLIPVDYSPEQQLEWIEVNHVKLFGGIPAPSSPSGGKGAMGAPDKYDAQAREKVTMFYGHKRLTPEQFEAKVAETKRQLMAATG